MTGSDSRSSESSRCDVSAALQRALVISRELLSVADSGDIESVQRLDAERLELLKSARAECPRPEGYYVLLREIAVLNDQALGFMEHRRRCKARDFDMAASGRRAVRAYSATGG